MATMLNEPGALTVKLALAALTIEAGVGIWSGVTSALPDAGPVPWLLVAVTEQLYCTRLVRPETMIGEIDPVPVRVACPVAVQVAV